MSLQAKRQWCTRAHGTQGYGNTKTDDGGMDGFHPYSYHLRKTEQVAIRFGFRKNYGIRAACWGHDVIEDTGKTVDDMLKAGFTEYEAGLAWACTDGSGATRHERKLGAYKKIQETPDAVVVKLCDRIANVEHGLKVGYLRKYNLYMGEQSEFEQALGHLSNDPRVAAMWEHLRWLFTEEARTQHWGTLHCCHQHVRKAA